MIDVSIVEDKEDIRESLKLILEGSRNCRCLSVFPDCESALKTLPDDPPDVVLMDIELPGISGIEGTRRLREKIPEIDIIMLTVHDENELIFDSLRAGACGYLLKNTPPDLLLSSIEEVFEGGSPMSSKIARMIVTSFKQSAQTPPLTKRQKEILTKLKEGKSYRMISDDLFISENTVKCHIKKIYRTLHVHTQAEAIATAIEKNLL